MKNLRIHLNVILINLFIAMVICPNSVSAIEIVMPSQTYSKNNITYYGYSLPTRVTNPTQLDNYVTIGLESHSRSGTQWEFDRSVRLPFENKETNKNFNLETDIWTDNILLDTSTTYISNVYPYRLSLSFHPGLPSDSADGGVLDSGYNINYSSYYTYSFYIEVTNKEQYDETLNNIDYLMPIFDCTSGYNENTNSYVCNTNTIPSDFDKVGSSSSSRILFNKISPTDSNYKGSVVYLVTVTKNAIGTYTAMFNNDKFEYVNSVVSHFEGNAILTSLFYDSGSKFNNWVGSKNINTGYYGSTYIRFSQPFNLILWSTSESLLCQEKCWTQSDTNNNNSFNWYDYTDETDNLITNLFGLKFLDDFGLGNIIFNVFGKFKSILSDHSNCTNFNISILDTNLTIPCGDYFWSRNDNSWFTNLWELFWFAFVGFFIARNMYITILSLFDFDSSISVEVEKKTRLKL